MTSDLAVDLGTGTTRIVDGRGRVLVNEPTIAAIDADSGRLLAFGSAALETGANGAGRVHLIRPVRRGQLVDLALTEAIVAALFKQVARGRLGALRAVVCVHVDSTPVQHRALEQALRKAGAREVRFVELPLAGALGAGLAIEEPCGSMVVEVGAGTSDVGVLALGGIVSSTSLPLGGDDLDSSVRAHVARRHGVLVDHATATTLRARLATASRSFEERGAEVLGRDMKTGHSTCAVVTRGDLAPLVAAFLDPILGACIACIAEAPPDVSNDLLGTGILLVGGLSALEGFDKMLATSTGLPVKVADDASLTAVRGARLCRAAFSVPARVDAARRR